MFLGSVTVKKCLARPTNVLWSHRGSLMFMEVDSSAAMFIWGKENVTIIRSGICRCTEVCGNVRFKVQGLSVASFCGKEIEAGTAI